MHQRVFTRYFKRQLKPLAKKDFYLEERIRSSLKYFNKNHAIPLGLSVFKMRVSSDNRGKSGGYRLYVLVAKVAGLLIPICIYPKSKVKNLRQKTILKHLGKTKLELKNRYGIYL